MNKNVPFLLFAVKTGQKRSINSPAPLSNPHLAMPNAMPPSGQQAVAAGSGGGAAASGSGPFASALRSLAIKADTKEDESANESGGADGASREGVTSGPVAYGSSLVGERSRDSSQPANLSKHSGGMSNNSRISVPQPQDLHARTLHHGQTSSSERNRAEIGLNEERIAQKKKLAVSPPPEKVILV